MGFIVTKGSEAGFITASHCTQPHPHNGGSTGRVFYQPTDQAGNRIATRASTPASPHTQAAPPTTYAVTPTAPISDSTQRRTTTGGT